MEGIKKILSDVSTDECKSKLLVMAVRYQLGIDPFALVPRCAFLGVRSTPRRFPASSGEPMESTHFVKMLTTPFCGVLACMAIKQAEIPLTTDIIEIDDKRVGVFHCSARPLVFCNAYLEYGHL